MVCVLELKTSLVGDVYGAINYLALFIYIKSLTKNYAEKVFSGLTKNNEKKEICSLEWKFYLYTHPATIGNNKTVTKVVLHDA